MLAHIPNGERQIILSKPIQSHLKLHGVDSRIRNRQSGIGNVLIADSSSKGSTVIVEELKTQRRVRYKVYVRGIQRHRVVAEEDSTPQFEIWHGMGRTGEVPL